MAEYLPFNDPTTDDQGRPVRPCINCKVPLTSRRSRAQPPAPSAARCSTSPSRPTPGLRVDSDVTGHPDVLQVPAGRRRYRHHGYLSRDRRCRYAPSRGVRPRSASRRRGPVAGTPVFALTAAGARQVASDKAANTLNDPFRTTTTAYVPTYVDPFAPTTTPPASELTEMGLDPAHYEHTMVTPHTLPACTVAARRKVATDGTPAFWQSLGLSPRSSCCARGRPQRRASAASSVGRGDGTPRKVGDGSVSERGGPSANERHVAGSGLVSGVGR
jgi:hypothetical protein